MSCNTTIPLPIWIMEVHNTTIRGAVMIRLRQCMEHDMSPNLSEVVHVHSLYVIVAHKSKMEVSPSIAQTGARLALDNATQ